MSVLTTCRDDANRVGRAVPDKPRVARALPAGCGIGTRSAAAAEGQPTFAAGVARPTLGDDAPEPPCFSLAALLRDLRPHGELDLRTLAYHLRQSDATAADGYCHAAINEARSFLEALVVNIVHAAQRDAKERDAARASGVENSRDRPQNGTAFRTHRRYLLEAGFIDADENDLLQYVYSVASAKGSHHGVTDEAWTRLARRIVFSTGQYLLQRYEAWKHNGRPVAPAPSTQDAPPRWGWLPRVVAVLGRKG